MNLIWVYLRCGENCIVRVQRNVKVKERKLALVGTSKITRD